MSKNVMLENNRKKNNSGSQEFFPDSNGLKFAGIGICIGLILGIMLGSSGNFQFSEGEYASLFLSFWEPIIAASAVFALLGFILGGILGLGIREYKSQYKIISRIENKKSTLHENYFDAA